METSRLIPIFVKIFYDVKIKEVVFALERFAPLPLQESYDNAGLQVGLTEVEASGALLCLDVTEEVIDEAVSLGCNLIVSHHPLLFHGLKTVSDRNYVERCVRKAIQNDVTVYAAHTNLDNAEDGVNFKIAEKLELEQVRLLLPHPVKVKDGEDPVKCGGKVIRIDGGFSKAYQPTTGIAGYTLISNSYGFILAAHEPLESAQAAIEKEIDIHSSRHMVEQVKKRTLMGDTDEGQQMKREIADLERLLKAYRTGEIPRQEQKGE